MNAKSRTVFITGVSSGIGLATARLLDDRGWSVFGTLRPGEDPAAVSSGMSERFRSVELELTDSESIWAAPAAVAAEVGSRGLDALVNNAGTILASPLEQLDLDAFRRLLEVNVVAQIGVTQAFLPLLRSASGRIVNMGSVSGISALPTIGPYCATKFALEALTDALRMELTPWRIPVSIIRPGSASTNIMRTAADDASGALDVQDPVLREYAQMIRGMSGGFRRSASGGIPPEAVAEKVYRALVARRPKTRYLVGPVARLRSAARILPDSLRDRLTLRALGRI